MISDVCDSGSGNTQSCMVDPRQAKVQRFYALLGGLEYRHLCRRSQFVIFRPHAPEPDGVAEARGDSVRPILKLLPRPLEAVIVRNIGLAPHSPRTCLYRAVSIRGSPAISFYSGDTSNESPSSYFPHDTTTPPMVHPHDPSGTRPLWPDATSYAR
jgi:hypothetical protein